MKLPVLPVYYYLDHFTEMLAFVAKTYGPILTDEHREFITRFENLSKDARCLFIRMLNRRGVIFDRSAFKYAEISDHESALDELAKCGHARPLQRNDYAAFIARLSKDALLAGAKSAGLTAVRSSWPKQKLVDHYVSEVAFATAVEYCGGNRYVALDNTKPVEFLLYLYFGKTEDNLKNFTLRDLGIIRINKSSSFSARFTDGEEALACFYYSQVLDRLEVKAADVYEQAAIGILSGPTCPTDYASDIHVVQLTRPDSSSKSTARMCGRKTSTALVRRRSAMSGSFDCCMRRGTKRAPKRSCAARLMIRRVMKNISSPRTFMLASSAAVAQAFAPSSYDRVKQLP
jgi:DNA polymerase-3 subunit epsilon